MIDDDEVELLTQVEASQEKAILIGNGFSVFSPAAIYYGGIAATSYLPYLYNPSVIAAGNAATEFTWGMFTDEEFPNPLSVVDNGSKVLRHSVTSLFDGAAAYKMVRITASKILGSNLVSNGKLKRLGQQAHYIISVNLIKNVKYIGKIFSEGWDINKALNGKWLNSDPEKVWRTGFHVNAP